MPINKIHTPWELSPLDQEKFKCVIGKDYPKPVVNLSESRNKALKAFSSIKVNS